MLILSQEGHVNLPISESGADRSPLPELTHALIYDNGNTPTLFTL